MSSEARKFVYEKNELNNQGIRQYAKDNGVRFWEIANYLGISEPSMTRKMRCKLPIDEYNRICKAINEIAHKKGFIR